MKFLKKVFLILIILFGITAMALFTLTRIINPDLIRDYVNHQLTALTAQPSTIHGNIHWQIFPTPGIHVTDVQIGAANAEAPYFAKLDHLFFNLNTKPLLQGKLVFSEIKINGFEMTMNMQSSLQKQATVHQSFEKPVGVQEKFAVKQLLLSNGTLHFINQGKELCIEQLQLGTDRFNMDHNAFPMQMKARIRYKDKAKQHIMTYATFKGTTLLTPEFINNPSSHLHDLQITGQLVLQNLSVHALSIHKLLGKLNISKGNLTLNPLTLALYQGESVGDLKYSFVTKKLKFNQTGTGLQGTKLLNDLFHQAPIKGTLDFSIHTELDLLEKSIEETMISHGMVSIHDGYLTTINLSQLVHYISNKIDQAAQGEKQNLSELLNRDQLEKAQVFKGTTAFKLATIEYQLNHAKIMSQSMLLHTPEVQFRGDGTMNLNDYAIQSKAFATITTPNNKRLEKIQNLLGGAFPLIIQGSLLEPIIYPDLKNMKPALSQWVGEVLIQPVRQIKQLKTLLDKTFIPKQPKF